MLYKNKSTIKSMIFSGLLAFGIMGVNDGFSSNYANNIFDISEQYKGNTIDQEQDQNLKNNIIGILNHKVGNQTFYDFLTSIPADKLITMTECRETDVGNILKKAFADSNLVSFRCHGIPNIFFDKYNKRLLLMFAYSSKYNSVYVSLFTYDEFGSSGNSIFRYRITKQPNGEYKFETKY